MPFSQANGERAGTKHNSFPRKTAPFGAHNDDGKKTIHRLEEKYVYFLEKQCHVFSETSGSFYRNMGMILAKQGTAPTPLFHNNLRNNILKISPKLQKSHQPTTP